MPAESRVPEDIPRMDPGEKSGTVVDAAAADGADAGGCRTRRKRPLDGALWAWALV